MKKALAIIVGSVAMLFCVAIAVNKYFDKQ